MPPAEPNMNDPLQQGIYFETGFIDSASEGMQDVQDEFDNTVQAMDGMVDDLSGISDDMLDVSDTYAKSFEKITDSTPDSLQLNTEVTGGGDGGGSQIQSMLAGMKEMFASMMDKFTRFGSKITTLLGPVAKLATAFAGVAAIAKIFSPILKMLAFWIGKVIEPFQFLIYDLMMQFRPVAEKVIEKGWILADKIFPAIADFIRKKLVPTFRNLIDKAFPAVESGIMTIVNAVMDAVDWFWNWKDKMEVIAPILIGVLAVALAAVTMAVWNLTAAFLANPMTWVAATAIALGVAIYQLWKHWSDLKAIVLETGIAIQKWFIEKINTAIRLIQKIPFLGEKLGITEIDFSKREKRAARIVRQLRAEPEKDASMLLGDLGIDAESIPFIGGGIEKPMIPAIPNVPRGGVEGISSKDIDKLGSRFESAISKQEKEKHRVTVSDRVRQLATFREM